MDAGGARVGILLTPPRSPHLKTGENVPPKGLREDGISAHKGVGTTFSTQSAPDIIQVLILTESDRPVELKNSVNNRAKLTRKKEARALFNPNIQISLFPLLFPPYLVFGFKKRGRGAP